MQYGGKTTMRASSRDSAMEVFQSNLNGLARAVIATLFSWPQKGKDRKLKPRELELHCDLSGLPVNGDHFLLTMGVVHFVNS